MSADAAEPIDPAAPRGGAREGGPAARPDAPAVGPTDAERARVLRLVPAGRPTVLNRPPTVPPPPEAMPTAPMPARPPHISASAPRHVPDDARTAVVPRISAEHRPENHAEVPAAPEVPTVAPEAAGAAEPAGAEPTGAEPEAVAAAPAAPAPAAPAPAVPEPAPTHAAPAPSPRPRAPRQASPQPPSPQPPSPRPANPGATTPLASPRSDVALAGEAVRAIWSRLDDQEADVAHWFGALLFSLAPHLRAQFPAQADRASRRLLRASIAAMSAVDRPQELAAAIGTLARETRALGLDASADEPIGVALVGAVREFAGELWAPGADAAWVLAYSLAAEPARRRAASLPGVVGGTVVGHRRLSWDLAVITVAPDVPVEYRPGQWVTVEVPQRPRMWRRLTPAGAPRADGLLEFHVRAVAGGWVSRSLVAHSQCGERWNIGPAEGDLTADATAERELLVVAGGTGAAVALALCEDLAAQAAAGADVRPTTVIVGGRTPEDLHTLDRFAVIGEDAPWLAVVGACESDPLDMELAPGTVVEAITRAGPWLEHDIVVAGSPDMIRATTAALLVDGTPLDRIHYDPFTDDDED
jgi:NAD(P)H-flavin reductase/hemoglobin-like flavoprotein